MSLKKLYILGFYEKVFEWLVTMIAKIYLHYISIFFLYFLHNLFFLLMSFSTPHHGQNPFNQIIKKWLPKDVSVDLLEKYLDMNAGL